MRKTDKPSVIVINGDNNKVFLKGKGFLTTAIVLGLTMLAVLTVSLRYPELLADFVRLIISIAISS